MQNIEIDADTASELRAQGAANLKKTIKQVRGEQATKEGRRAARTNDYLTNVENVTTDEVVAAVEAEIVKLNTPETPTVTPVAPAKANARRDAELAERARLHDERSAEYAAVVALHKQGLSRADIAKQLDTTYSRLTFVLWHHQYGIDAIPGMATYTKAKKGAAQARYEADVAARKAAK